MRLDQVGKRYGWRYPWVLREVSLEIPAGRLIRFEGRNGSGKSTLLRIIAGVAQPSRGSVTGRPVTGYVPERFPPALPFPAGEYLAHLGRMHGLTGAQLRARVEECLDRLGGRELVPVPLRTMSKGMAQKVAVAQALLPPAAMLVLDEAWTGMDVQAKAALDDVVAERVAAGSTVVFVDHDPARLAGLEAERWQLQGAAVVPAGSPEAGAYGANGADGAAGAAGASGPGELHTAGPGDVTVIEVSGWPAAGFAAGQPLPPGVLTIRRDGGLAVIRAEPAAADSVLRQLLAAGDDVHVIRVGTQADPGEPPSGGVPDQ